MTTRVLRTIGLHDKSVRRFAFGVGVSVPHSLGRSALLESVEHEIACKKLAPSDGLVHTVALHDQRVSAVEREELLVVVELSWACSSQLNVCKSSNR